MRYPSYIARRLQECLDLSPLRHSGMIEDDETVVTWSTLTAGGSAHGETEGIAAGPVAEEVEPVVGEEKTMSKPTEEIAVNIGQTSKYSIESNQRLKMEQFNLKWNNYFHQLSDAFGSLLDEEDLVDVTLSCEGKKVKAHKMLLSACSPYFRDVFKENPCQHPVIVFRNVSFADLSAILEFIYKGEVSVAQEQLDSFLSTAELLEIKGLTDDDKSAQDSTAPIKQEQVSPQLSRPVEKRKASESSFHSSKTVNPPMKKRKPGNAKRPPVITPVAVKVETTNYEEDTNLDEDSNNLTEVREEEFDQTQLEEDSCKVEEAEMDSEPPRSDDLIAEEAMQAEASKPPVEDPKQKETPPKVKEEPEKKVALKSALKSPNEDKQPAAKKAVTIKKPAVIKPSKPTQKEVNLPKGLSVTVRPVLKEQNLNEPAYMEEDNISLRSEDAKTPVDEDLTNAEAAEDPISGEEAPEEPEEPMEPEFDYYGCETCKVEARPVVDKLLLTHKCPICPCVCFCAHLLKEHMHVMHGWFNVQRRFTQY